MTALRPHDADDMCHHCYLTHKLSLTFGHHVEDCLNSTGVTLQSLLQVNSVKIEPLSHS